MDWTTGMNGLTNRIGVLLIGAAMLCGIGIVPATGADVSNVAPTTAADSAGSSTAAELAETIEECRQNLARLRADLSAAKQSAAGIPRFLTAELELWERLELVTLQRRGLLDEDAAHRGELASLERQEAEREPPRSFLAVDELRDRLESEREQLRSLRLEWQAEKRITASIKDKHVEAEQLRRRAEERYELSAPEERTARNRERVLARLQSRVLGAELDLHRQQSTLMSVRIETLEMRSLGLEGTVKTFATRFTLTKDELKQRLTLIEQMENQVRQQLAEVDARLHQAMQHQVAGTAATASTASSAAFDVAREESQLFQRLLSGVGEFKECWRRRYALSNGRASAGQVESWLAEIRQTSERVAEIVRQLEHRTQQRRETLSLVNRATLAGDQATSREELAKQTASLHRIIDVYGEIRVLAAGGERLCRRLVEDLEARQDGFSWTEYAQLTLGGMQAAWEYELTSIDDEPITVRKIVFGLVLLLCGYYVSRLLASVLALRVSPKFGVSPAGAAVLRSMLFYLFVTGFGFASLEIVNVPLTVFAFLGGAVAIGVGFGSQNLINNFISGLILLVERPIRVGDLVNVEGIDANVEHIGARSTRVRTGANLEILVPNSKFLENNVTNWTLSDTRTRVSVSVGVAYGSPVRQVAAILKQVIADHEGVLTSPEPIVLFQDFADSSLIFEAHFWVHMRRMMDGAKIRSEVRMTIDDAFRDAGVVIAFPQRDVHIDMSSPLEVRLSEPARMEVPRRRAA